MKPTPLGVLPRALRGDGEDGELRTVRFPLAGFRVGSDEAYQCYGIEAQHDMGFKVEPQSWLPLAAM